jgi:hypothetical protein
VYSAHTTVGVALPEGIPSPGPTDGGQSLGVQSSTQYEVYSTAFVQEDDVNCTAIKEFTIQSQPFTPRTTLWFVGQEEPHLVFSERFGESLPQLPMPRTTISAKSHLSGEGGNSIGQPREFSMEGESGSVMWVHPSADPTAFDHLPGGRNLHLGLSRPQNTAKWELSALCMAG